MAKFCGNCGAELDDSARVCGKCGTPVDKAAAKATRFKVINPEKQKKRKKTIKRVLMLAVLVVAAVIVFNLMSQYTGYNGLIRKVMTAYEKYDIDTLISVSSDMYFYGEKDWVEWYFEYNVGEDLDYFESSVGHSYKLSYEVNEIYTISERNLGKMLSEIKSLCKDFDIDTIEEIVVADVTVTAKKDSQSANQDIAIVMSKEGKKWRLLYIE